MRLRKLVCAVGLVASFGADVALGLGLGEIQLKSTVNEPLKAEIKLLQVRDLEQDEIFITLASKEEFQRAGVDRNFFLQELRFQVDLDAADGPLVRVSTRNPVKEPYLNFLLETQWPSGRLLREYTLLMDLPVFDSSAEAGAVQGAQTVEPSPQPQAVRQPAPQASTAPSNRQSYPSASRSGDVYGPVGASDTLWDIALKVRPNKQTSVQQTMLAIQRLNPEAFINNNINLLRRGQVLRVPSVDDIYEVDQRQAVNEVAYQNAKWSDEDETGATLQSSRSSGTISSPASEGRGRLSLAAPQTQEDLPSAQGSGGDSSASARVMENELAIALEELDRTQRENKDLTTRIMDLEKQIQTMERLVTVSNSEAAALEQSIRQGKAAAEEGQSATEGTSESTAETVTDVAATSDEAPKAAAAKAPAANKVVSSKPAKPSLLDSIKENILYVGAAGLALIAAVIYMLRRRRDEDEPDTFEEEEFLTEDESSSDEPLFVDDGDEEITADDSLEESVAEEVDEPTESLTGDAVGEADIYIAYGKFDQAEEMLLNALASDSGNTAVVLKLLEVYSETENVAEFDKHYARLLRTEDTAAIDRADELRALIPGVGEFDASAVQFESQETVQVAPVDLDEEINSQLGDEFSLDLGDDSSTDVATTETDEFEFTLDDPAEETLELETEQAALDTDDDLDLDLDFSADEPVLGDALDDISFDIDGSETEEVTGLDDFALDLGDDQEVDSLFESDSELESEAEDWNAEEDIDVDELLTFEEAAAGDGTPYIEDDAGIDAADLALDLNGDLPESLDLSEPVEPQDDADDFEFSLASEEDEDIDTAADFSAEGQLDELSAEIDADLDDLDIEVAGDGEIDDDFGLGGDVDLDDEFTLELDDEEAEQSDSLSSDLDLASSFSTAATDEESETGDLEFEDTRAPVSEANLSDEEFNLALDVQEGGDLVSADDTSELALELDESGDSDVEADDLDATLVSPAIETEALEDDFSFDFGDDLALDAEESVSAEGMDEPEADDAEELTLDVEDEFDPSLGLDDELSAADTGSDLELDVESTEDADLSVEFDSEADFAIDAEPESEAPTEEPLDELASERVDLDIADDDLGVMDLGEEDDLELSFDEELELGTEADSEPSEPGSEALSSAESLDFDLGDELTPDNVDAGDAMFAAAVSDIPEANEPFEFTAEDMDVEDEEEGLDFLVDTDEVATKLDLARAYIDMGDRDGAKDILDEVVAEGSDQQRQEAEELIARI